MALAEATVNCTETIGPESFTIDKDKGLQKKFSQCTGGTADQQATNLKKVEALLALQSQEMAHPRLKECLTSRYSRWQKFFERTQLLTCPAWRERKVLAEADRNTALQLAKTQPQLEYVETKPGASKEEKQKHEEHLQRLKRSSQEDYLAFQLPAKTTVSYKISYPDTKPEACVDVAVCSAQCAAFLPGFVVSAAADQLVADPVSWYGDQSKAPCPASATANPYCPPYVHGMAITITSPDSTVPAGDLYGHPNRGGNGEKCVRWVADDHHGPGTYYITDLLPNGTGGNSLSKCGY